MGITLATSTTRVGLLLSFAALLVFSIGCEQERPYFRVRGTVKFKKDESVATFGAIEFRSEAEPIVVGSGTIIKNGSFTINSGERKGAVGGWHTVVIMQPIKDPHRKVSHDHGLEAARKYLDHRSTDLRVEINEETASNLVLMIDDNGK
jgi:hypothetical protein